MGLYRKYVLPKVVHYACSARPNMRQRQKVVPRARGRVLEIGIGSGLNLPFYDADKVEKVWGLDPSPEMRAMAGRAAASVPFEVELIGLPGEEIPLDGASVDSVVVTYTLCTIPETTAALRQVRRVLRSGGELIFCEHGAAPDASVRRWQDRVNPLWKRLGGGCNLNRAIPELLESGGFRITSLDTMYLPGWRPASFNYWGAAVPR
jgi:ubiquinone/menaquinone biosynthesis C-methylase UbiE